jgi:DNA-binding MarR family transcriptional regulator
MKDKYIVYFVSKTKKKMTKFIEKKLIEKGLTDLAPSYGNILTVLYDNEGSLRIKDIGDLLGKEKSTMTTLINNLEKHGYVEKVRDENDRRNTYVRLTDKARRIENEFNEISAAVQERAYNNFSKDEKDELLRLLKKLNQNFD